MKLKIDVRLVISIVTGCMAIMLICFGIKHLISNDIIITSVVAAVPTYFLLQIVFKNEIVTGYYMAVIQMDNGTKPE